MNHTPEPANAVDPTAKEAKKPVCGWCVSTHVADITCSCKEPCDKGWCTALGSGDPFAVSFL